MDILNFFQELREAFPLLFEYMANSAVMAFIALGVVYMIGRMLNLLKGDVPKNVVALITIIVVGWFLAYMKYEFSRPVDTEFWLFIWDITLYVSGAVVFYVLVAFKLYERIDSLLDKKIGADQKPASKKKKGKK